MKKEIYCPLDGDQALVFLGIKDRNLRFIEKKFDCDLVYRENTLIAQNISEENSQKLEKTIQRIMEGFLQKTIMNEQDIQEMIGNGNVNKAELLSYTKQGKPIFTKNYRQQQFVEKVRENIITFAVGSAGTGKTFLAVALAVLALKNGEIEKIILSRPAVEAGENLGYLPGDIREKLDPYFMPLYDSLEVFLGREQLEKYLEKGIIEIIPFAYMRGRTFQDAYILLDEAQNTSISQMLMFLTRLGKQSKMIITGDISQIDLPIKKAKTGMVFAIEHLQNIEEIACVYFQKNEIVRHPLIEKIVERFQEGESL